MYTSHPLDRLLLYTDKKDRHEFNISEKVWYEFYELFTTTKYNVLDDKYSAVDFFNEVFYCLTFTYANEEAAEWLNDYLNRESPLCPYMPDPDSIKSQKEQEAARKYQEKIEDTNWYILAFVWAILMKQPELPPHVKVFLAALQSALTVDYGDFYLFEEFPKEHPDKYAIPFDINPKVEFPLFVKKSEEWRDATSDFDREVVAHIVQRFWDPEDKETIIDNIRHALKKENLKPSAEPLFSRITHRKKANEKFLDTLLTSAKKDLEYAETHALANNISHDGFAVFILHDHRKVIDVLLLITHLGYSQMPLFIKCIKALQSLGYVRKDCFDDIDIFITKTKETFDNISLDRANVKKNIDLGSRVRDDEYRKLVKTIEKYLDVVIQS